jgi:ADP-heptose:LPS heptosyltransferase
MPFRLADFYNETRGARKLIVIDLGYLGDSIHLVPTLAEIKQNYPQAELHVASAPVGSELLALVPCVDRTWALPRSPNRTPWREQWQWIRAVRQERFAAAFNFSGTDRTVILTYLTGAPKRVAFAGGRDHFWNRWLIPNWVPRVDRTVHLAEQRRQVLAACGLHVGPLQYPIQIPASGEAWAEQNVPKGAVHFSINAGHALKEWPIEHWSALARELLSTVPELRLLATGTSSTRERDRLKHFARSVDNERLQVYPGSLTLVQLAALLKRCQLHVGADSGALHLATVLGVKTVSLFREYAGLDEWKPRGPGHRSLVAPCRCVNQKIQPCAREAKPACLANLSVAAVRSLISELMHS